MVVDKHLNFSDGQFHLSGEKDNNTANIKNSLAVCTDV